MPFLSRPPRAALGDVIHLLWAVDAPGLDHLERRLPTARPQLLVHRRRDRLSWDGGDGWAHVGGAAISGPFAHALTLDAAQQDGVLGVVFRPGGLAAFTSLPIEHTAAVHHPIEAVMPHVDWGRALDAARAVAPDEGLQILERALLAARCARRDPAIAAALTQLRRSTPVAHVADALGWSQTRLVRRFSAQVGLRPKEYARLARFRRAVASLGPRTDLGMLALGCGYADQAHFNHEFRRFAGMTPSAWRAAVRPYETHVRLPR